jgi:endogenous inhibitor of DNA gyrase (YacG/DUF329 family)
MQDVRCDQPPCELVFRMISDLTPTGFDTMSEQAKDFHCRRCRRPVARTNGVDIYFDARPVPYNPTRIKFQCPHCRQTIEWNRKPQHDEQSNGKM